MPKYYRFRATTPNRKPKQSKVAERREKGNDSFELNNNRLDLKFACAMLPSWYLRRTSWRDQSLGLPRQLAGWRTGQLSRPMFLFLSHDVSRVLF